MNAFELTLNEKALAKRGKMMDKLSRAEERLQSTLSFCESQPSYLQNRWDDSVNSFQLRLEALEREEEEAVAEFRKKYQARRENIKQRLEEAKKRQGKQKTLKPREVHQAEVAVKIILEEMDSYGLLSPKERQRLWELRGEKPAQQPPSNTEPSPPPKEPEMSQDVKDFVAERGGMPASHDELQLFLERREMLKEMAREKRERERQEEEKKEEAKRQYQLQREAEQQQEAAKREAKRQSELEEAELIAKAAAAAKVPVPEVDLIEFEGKKMTKFEKEQMLKARKRQEELEEEEESEASSDTDSDDGYDSEEYRIMLQKQKETLKRQHEERMKRKTAVYTPPPPPPPQEYPKILANTKTKKTIKMPKH